MFLIMGSVLHGYMFRYQYCLVGGLEAIVFGSIRWCVWSFRPSSPLRLPHLLKMFVVVVVVVVVVAFSSDYDDDYIDDSGMVHDRCPWSLVWLRHGRPLCSRASIVVPPVSALSSLRYADFWALSSTGRVPLSVLVKYVAICVRVGRQCHQSGGTDMVDLPDILLPEDQYLDMFDFGVRYFW